MIELHEVQRMGYVLKTHGVNGELVVSAHSRAAVYAAARMLLGIT